jgi:hypothetical protein
MGSPEKGKIGGLMQWDCAKGNGRVALRAEKTALAARP